MLRIRFRKAWYFPFSLRLNRIIFIVIWQSTNKYCVCAGFEGDNGKRTIKVVNPNDFYKISGKRLSELVQENRKKYS